MRVVVIGASGQLGSDLMTAFAAHKTIGVDHKMFDIEVPAAMSKLLSRYEPDLVINTAAFQNVELCETRPDRAFAVNALAVGELAAQCANSGAILAPHQYRLRLRWKRNETVSRRVCGSPTIIVRDLQVCRRDDALA